MITAIVVLSVMITVISLLLACQLSNERAYAQTQTQGTNFTQLFSTDKEFQVCFEYTEGCFQPIKVLYHDPTLLVLQSDYLDVIWKGVARAQKEGYQVNAMTSYATSGVLSDSPMRVNLLVAMSK
jgi:hypothetical protein